ncbi:MAG: alpha/beta fold hydrolase [Myxococcales bacterium]|nr:alpha/beta fold hydrolase [Myxococcales bacterium]
MTTVLLHGFTGRPMAWDAVLAQGPLGDGSVVRPELLGHGPVPPPSAGSFLAEVDRLGEELRTQGVRDALIVGYSMGARVALGLLLRHGDLFSSAVLIGVHPGIADTATRAARRAEDLALADRIEGLGVEAFVHEWEGKDLFSTQGHLPTEVIEGQRSLRLSHLPEGLATAVRVLGLGAMPDLTEAFDTFPGSVRLVVGSEDAKFRCIAEGILRAYPRVSLNVVEGAGHNVPLEKPKALYDLLRGAP